MGVIKRKFQTYLALHFRLALFLNLITVLKGPLRLRGRLHVVRVDLSLGSLDILHHPPHPNVVAQSRNRTPTLVDLPVDLGDRVTYALDFDPEFRNLPFIVFDLPRALRQQLGTFFPDVAMSPQEWAPESMKEMEQ
jgi:hypothetical protein